MENSFGLWVICREHLIPYLWLKIPGRKVIRMEKYPVYGWADFLGKRNYDRISDINCYRGDYLAFREISLSYSFASELDS